MNNSICMQTVTAAVIEQNGKVLIARRRAGDRFGGLWEFPGGKLESGESPEQCLLRELREELGVEAKLDGLVGSFPYVSSWLTIELVAYRVTIIAGCPAPIGHEELRWVSPAELDKFRYTEPDLPLVGLLRKEHKTKEKHR